AEPVCAGENELTITTMTAPRPLGRNGALLAAFCLSFAAMSVLQQQRLQGPSVSLHLNNLAIAVPHRPTLYKIEDAMGPRTLLDRWNPVARDNVLAAAAYLAWLKQPYGFPGMFGAYNFGPGNWEDHLHHNGAPPAET